MFGELDVDDAGLRGMVASAKISLGDWYCFSDMLEYGGGGCEISVANDVSSGESVCIWRFALGELGSPLGDSGG